MGAFHVGCKVANHIDRHQAALSVVVDPQKKKLVAAGPILVA